MQKKIEMAIFVVIMFFIVFSRQINPVLSLMISLVLVAALVFYRTYTGRKQRAAANTAMEKTAASKQRSQKSTGAKKHPKAKRK